MHQLKQYLSTSDVVPIARLGMAWIVIVLIACVATANLQQSMVIKYAERFTAWQYQDFVRPLTLQRRYLVVIHSQEIGRDG